MYLKILHLAVDVSQKELSLLSLDERNATSLQEQSDYTCIKITSTISKIWPKWCTGKDIPDVKVVDGDSFGDL